jgi:hypothetical protein
MIDFYLSGPYSHEDPNVLDQRHQAHVEAAAWLMEEGFTVFSPIAHSHHIGQHINRALDEAFWMRQDVTFIPHCSRLVVLMIDGLEWSRGTQLEISCAQRNDLELYKLTPSADVLGGYILEKGTPQRVRGEAAFITKQR